MQWRMQDRSFSRTEQVQSEGSYKMFEKSMANYEMKMRRKLSQLGFRDSQKGGVLNGHSTLKFDVSRIPTCTRLTVGRNIALNASD